MGGSWTSAIGTIPPPPVPSPQRGGGSGRGGLFANSETPGSRTIYPSPQPLPTAESGSKAQTGYIPYILTNYSPPRLSPPCLQLNPSARRAKGTGKGTHWVVRGLPPPQPSPAAGPLPPARGRVRERGAFRQLRDARQQNHLPLTSTPPARGKEEDAGSLAAPCRTPRERKNTGWRIPYRCNSIRKYPRTPGTKWRRAAAPCPHHRSRTGCHWPVSLPGRRAPW